MTKTIRIVQVMFGVPWLVFGIQHFMYADFVASLVPAYFPARLFLAFFTGAAMFAAGLSLIANIKSRLAAALLGVMLLMFILLTHIPKITSDATIVMSWTRAFQDVAIASAAFMLAGALSRQENGGLKLAAKISYSAFAVLLIVFGFYQFFDLDFLPAKVAPYLPLRTVLVYITGIAMVVTAASVFIGKKTEVITSVLGIWMLVINLLLHIYLLANAPYNPIFWTGAMIDLAITCGVFVLAFAFASGPSADLAAEG